LVRDLTLGRKVRGVGREIRKKEYGERRCEVWRMQVNEILMCLIHCAVPLLWRKMLLSGVAEG
jgi:hypothetical protein